MANTHAKYEVDRMKRLGTRVCQSCHSFSPKKTQVEVAISQSFYYNDKHKRKGVHCSVYYIWEIRVIRERERYTLVCVREQDCTSDSEQ